MSGTVEFDAPDLAAKIEELSQFELDQLPFGVVLIDREGTVLFYSATEARLSGYGMGPLGKNLFDVSRCANKDDLRSRIMRAMEEGPVDLEFGWSGDRANAQSEMRIRVQSARRGGAWIFVERDRAAA